MKIDLQSPPGGRTAPAEVDWRVAKLVSVASLEFRDHRLSLARLASQLGTSPGFLGRLFRRQVGVSFHRHLLELRMQAALSALATCESVKSAAHSSGYSDTANFSNDFLRYFGNTPNFFKDKSLGPREIMYRAEQVRSVAYPIWAREATGFG